MSIRTIILDLGNTLVPFSLDPLAPELAACRPAAMALAADSETGVLPPDGLQRALCALTGMPSDRFPAWWTSIFADRWLIPPALLRHWLAHYRVGLLSNTNALHFDHLRRRWPLLDEFNFHILSYEVGAVKPSPRIFDAAEAAAHCGPAEILYLDDIAAYTATARARGWNAETFVSFDRLTAQLAPYGVTLASD